jgi:signal transduction histidine kinase
MTVNRRAITVRGVRALLGATWSRPSAGSVDTLIAVVLFGAMAAQLALTAAVHPLAAGGAGLVVSAAVGLRRRWPFAALSVAMAAMLVQIALGGRLAHSAAAAILALAILVYGGGAYLAGSLSTVALALGVVVPTFGVWIQSGSISTAVTNALLIGALPWSAGRMLRVREAGASAQRELAERVDARREADARAATLEERTRIARELHDVIAHSVSVMVIHAGGARLVMGTDTQQAEISLRAAEHAGREALAEIRRLLGVLDTTDEPGELAPQPSLVDVPALIARAQAAGVATQLSVEGQPAAISPALDLCAYRIVQEALTNILKHAEAARAAVSVRWTAEAVELEVSDDGRGNSVISSGDSGHGLAGMRERARMHGGTLQIGPGAAGGFLVRARLPYAAEVAT